MPFKKRQEPNGMSEIERQRLELIAARDKLLAPVKQAAQAGPPKRAPKRPAGDGSKSAKPVKRVKVEDTGPRRSSSRLAGIQADSEVAREKEEKQYEEQREADRQRRMRRTDDLSLGDITVNGKSGGFFGSDAILRPVAKPYERTFGEDDVKSTTDKDLRKAQEKISNLRLWDAWDPTRIKITPERIYSATFHPTEDKPIVFMGDKLGHLGIVDASQKLQGSSSATEREEDDRSPSKRRLKKESSPVADDDDEEEDDVDPEITTIKPHTRTICSMHIHSSTPQTLFTGSYDSSIRSIDLSAQKATEVWGPSDPLTDLPISGIDMAPTDPNVISFTTLSGQFGQHDLRTKPAGEGALYQLSEKKIGGFTLNPSAPHYLATASLDRTLRLWDLRKMSKKLPTLVGEHESRLSVSHAAFNTAGQVATSSYDDTIKIHSFGVGNLEAMHTWKSGFTLPEDVMKPEVVVRHNNQTGRWVTILRPQWQRYPSDGLQKLVIGNMNRFVDVYAADGTQLGQLGGDGITAVPAVAVFHARKDWIAAGTASGKLCLWI